MIISYIQGGLGNQMFQYAAGRALASRLEVELKLDLSWFIKCEGCTQRDYLLEKAFSITPAVATSDECAQLTWHRESRFSRLVRRFFQYPPPHANTCIYEPHSSYWPGFDTLTSPSILFGYWQNERYFKNIETTIRREFVFPAFRDNAQTLAERIRTTKNSVAVHVRRGDYASDPAAYQCHGICSKEYYDAALKYLITKLGSIELFLFSDEPLWVRDYFNCLGLPSTLVNFPEYFDAPWHDMHLMSLCNHHIIANSTFSWWGAWLSSKNGIICAPRKWFADTNKIHDSPVPRNWIHI